ncbi:transposase [Neisseria sp. ZJ106]|uniref:Transposase n=1 Tax=Neisseria lisongii TaxID=2912188 RepID=A0ABY7RJB7_9NEIS|nr:transposase [Neisseria lisongii]MCF7521237.1 transposase [Neisseria lisongii]WCL71729.1 transposase [Neisseria lisongii]
MDITYFGRGFGVMVLMNSLNNQIIHKQCVSRENAALYESGLRAVMDKGIHIQSIIADAFKGLAKLFPEIPFQLCQFHQQQTIRRYLTRRPKSAAAKELKALTDSLFTASYSDFEQELKLWHRRYKSYLDEVRYSSDGGQKRYTHKRLRSAYNSLKRNPGYLFTYEQNQELMMPNTANRLEAKFGKLKTKKALSCGD